MVILLINWLIIRPYTLLFKLKAPSKPLAGTFHALSIGPPRNYHLYSLIFLSLLVSTNSFKNQSISFRRFGLNN